MSLLGWFDAKMGRLTLAASCLAVLLPAGLIAERSYRAAHDMFAPAVVSPLLRHTEATGVQGLRDVSFPSADRDTIAAWYVPSKNRAAVVVTHGTNDDRSSMLAEVRLLAGAGFGVLAFDWPGLGASSGTIRWDSGAQFALAAAVNWLSARSDVDEEKIGGLGFSIGGVMLVRFASADQRVRALVLEGTPPSFDDYVAYHYARWGPLSEWPARLALWNSDLMDEALAPDRLIGKVAPRPVFLIGGDRDTEVPEALVDKLYAAAREPKSLWIVRGARHGHYAQIASSEYAKRVTDFFEATLVRSDMQGQRHLR